MMENMIYLGSIFGNIVIPKFEGVDFSLSLLLNRMLAAFFVCLVLFMLLFLNRRSLSG